MSVIQPIKPQYNGIPGLSAPGNMIWVAPAPGQAFNDGDILINKVTGTVYAPNPNGSIATAAGPVLGTNMTLGITTSSGAPAQDYFGIASYAGAAAIESQASAPFVISCPAGYVPTVVVSSTGAPAGATGFFVYLGTIPGNYAQQNHSATSLGSTFTASNPLTNSFGAGRAATGASTGLIGIADEQSTNYFAGYPGGSSQTGPRSLFGASQAMSPGWDNDAFKLPAIKLNSGLFLMTLLQPWYSSLENSAGGIAIDTGNTFIAGGTGFFIVDNTQTACLTIRKRLISNPGVEQDGDVGARVLVEFYAAALA